MSAAEGGDMDAALSGARPRSRGPQEEKQRALIERIASPAKYRVRYSNSNQLSAAGTGIGTRKCNIGHLATGKSYTPISFAWAASIGCFSMVTFGDDIRNRDFSRSAACPQRG